MVSSSSAPTILCAGIAVQDIVFRVEQFPQPGGKCMTNEFIVVSGGCAVNAAIAVARLGGRARYAGPLGDDNDNVSNQLMAEMAREGIDTSGRGARRRRHRAGVGHHGRRRRRADDRHPPRQADRDGAHRRSRPAGRGCFAAPRRQPLSRVGAAGVRGGAAARHSDRARRRPARRVEDDPLFAHSDPRHLFRRMPARHDRASTICPPACSGWRRAPRHFSRSATAPGRCAISPTARSAPCRCSRSRRSTRWRPATCSTPASRWRWRKAATRLSAMRFGAAAAGLKCTRFGGSMGAPKRAEVEAFLARQG